MKRFNLILIGLLFPVLIIAQTNLISILDGMDIGIGYSDRQADRYHLEAGVYHKKVFVGLSLEKANNTSYIKQKRQYLTNAHIAVLLSSTGPIKLTGSVLAGMTSDYYSTYSSIGLNYIFNNYVGTGCYDFKERSMYSKQIFSPSLNIGYLRYTHLDNESANLYVSRIVLQPGFDLLFSRIVASFRYTDSIRVRLTYML